MPREFISRYTHDLTSDDLGKLFTRETPEAYRFFARGINTAELEGLPWYQKVLRYAQGFFLAFTMRLSPARRAMYGIALAMSVLGLLQLFNGFGLIRIPIPIALFFVNIRVPSPVFAAINLGGGSSSVPTIPTDSQGACTGAACGDPSISGGTPGPGPTTCVVCTGTSCWSCGNIDVGSRRRSYWYKEVD